MTTNKDKIFNGKKIALIILSIQTGVVILLSLFFFILEKYFLSTNFSSLASFSALVGGLVYLIPFSVYTIFAICKKTKSNFAGLVLLDFFIAFFLKFVLLIVLFIVVFKFLPTIHFIVLLSFGILFITQFISFLLLNNHY